MNYNNKVIVEFKKNLTANDIINQIIQIKNPQIIFWYIGYNGLKKESVNFYKNIFINPILKQNYNSYFWLIDLTAWKAFKDSSTSITEISSHCEYLENFSNQIKCLKSADIFKIMQTITDKNIINYFKKYLKKSFIKKMSEKFSLKKILVREIFFNNCPIMSDFYDYDAAKAYSTFQYFEGCLLVKEIFLKTYKNTNSKKLQIIFILPNDELNYYKDNDDSFQKDINFILQEYFEKYDTLKIIFYSFSYGTEIYHRPYNAPGTVIKKNNLKKEDIIGYV